MEACIASHRDLDRRHSMEHAARSLHAAGARRYPDANSPANDAPRVIQPGGEFLNTTAPFEQTDLPTVVFYPEAS